MSDVSPAHTDLAEVTRLHQQLCERALKTSSENVTAVLNLGTAVLMHGSLEPAHLATVLRWVDPTVLHRLSAEHAALAKDLEYLDELRHADPESADIAVMADAILCRLRDHLELDERTLYRPLARLREVEERPEEGL